MNENYREKLDRNKDAMTLPEMKNYLSIHFYIIRLRRRRSHEFEDLGIYLQNWIHCIGTTKLIRISIKRQFHVMTFFISFLLLFRPLKETMLWADCQLAARLQDQRGYVSIWRPIHNLNRAQRRGGLGQYAND